MDSDDDEAGPSYQPVGVSFSTMNSRRGAWQGEELEHAHAKESAALRQQPAAVDLEQFRNYQVGQGYQAKHVVRQRAAQAGTSPAQPPGAFKPADGTNMSWAVDPEKKKRKRNHREEEHTKGDAVKTRLQRYLNSPGLREFRKEIYQIEKAS